MTTTKKRPLSEVLAWDGGRLVVTDHEVVESALRRKTLSPSTMKAMKSCRARWVIERLMPRADDPWSPAGLGTAAHRVMEDLFALPGYERTEARAMALVIGHSMELWSAEDDETVEKRNRWVVEVFMAYKGLFDIENPQTVQTHHTEQRITTAIDGVPFMGIVDRTELIEDGVKVVDYKSGKKMPTVKYDDSHGDQGRVYALAIEALTGTLPAEVWMYYTRLGKQRRVPITRSALNKTKRAFLKAWKDLNDNCDTASFETKPTPLCGWCPLVNACPVAAAKGLGDRTDLAPKKGDLNIPTIRAYEAPEVVEPVFEDFGSAAEFEPRSDVGLNEHEIASLVTFDGTEREDAPVDDDDDTQLGEAPLEALDENAGNLPVTEPDVVRKQQSTAHVNESEAPASKEGTAMTQAQLREDKTWIELVDGRLNPNSYAAQAVFGMTTLAYEQIAASGLPLTKDTIDGLSQTFLKMVLHAQANITGNDSLMEGANSRCRGALRTYIECNPVPFGKDSDTWKEWALKGAKHIGSIASSALRLYDAAQEPIVRPWDALALRQVPDSDAG